MGFFDVLRTKKNGADLTFEPIPPKEHATLESNAGVLEDPTIEEIKANVPIMLQDADSFITLTPKTAIGGIRYMQACRIPDGINVQLGLEKSGRIHLVEKTTGEKEVLRLFQDFFCGHADIEINEYQPIKLCK